MEYLGSESISTFPRCILELNEFWNAVPCMSQVDSEGPSLPVLKCGNKSSFSIVCAKPYLHFVRPSLIFWLCLDSCAMQYTKDILLFPVITYLHKSADISERCCVAALFYGILTNRGTRKRRRIRGNIRGRGRKRRGRGRQIERVP